MTKKNTDISAVPTNIITGFLGVGKTSTILHLLKTKPNNERWAVLVNEFGEIGVDGSLLEGQQVEENGVYIREVPGGCMCCAAGVPMQVALNQLLSNAKPDRLLIEPTGLGHPKEVFDVLSSEHYQDVLSLQKILTLVDARKLSEERYTSHDTFNQQIAIADTLVGNKSDLYEEGDREKLVEYSKQQGTSNATVIFSEFGEIDLDTLEGSTSRKLSVIDESDHHDHSHDHHTTKPLLSDVELPDCGFIKAVNQGEGYESIGWRFSAETRFDHSKLSEFVWKSGAERVKAVFNTNTGVCSFNFNKDVLTEVALDYSGESRIETISKKSGKGLDAKKLEESLMKCILV